MLCYTGVRMENIANEPGLSYAPVERTPLHELRKRAGRLQGLMREAGVDGVLATQNADVYYLSGTLQQAQVYLPVAGEAVVTVRKHAGRASLDSSLPGGVVAVRSLRELPDIIEAAGGRPDTIGFELDTLPVANYQAYEKALQPLGARLVDSSSLFRRVRAIKSEYEVSLIRKAAEVADVALRAAAANLREGIREVELAALVEAAARVAGHSGAIRIRAYGQEMHMGQLLAGRSGAVPSFMNSPTGGTGPGPWSPVGAGPRTIERGEPVFLDYTGEWGGYIADQTRMLSIGRLSSFWLDAYAAMREVQRRLERAVVPGITSGDVFDMALQYATELGYAEHFMGPPDIDSPGQKVAFVGHGVGLELDEWPPMQRGTDAPLESGMVLAVEPKLIIEGKGAIGIEDTYLVTPGGLEALTFSTRDIVEVG
jgi:Xaa-Pro dipeptidase